MIRQFIKMEIQVTADSEDYNGKDLASDNIFNLTGKDISILSSLAKGKSYKMVAEDYGITINTVREHIRNIYHKMNVHSTTAAVLLAVKHGLIHLSTLIYLIA